MWCLLFATAALAGFAGVFWPVPQNIFSPPKRGSFFWWGGVANPPNPETRGRSFDGSGRDALHWIPRPPEGTWGALVSITLLASHGSGRIMLLGSDPLFSCAHQINHALT
jgi:hypothetical protein